MAVLRDGSSWYPRDIYLTVERFERLLTGRCNVRLSLGVSSNEVFGHLLDLVSAFERETPDTATVDGRSSWRVALGLMDIASKTLFAESHANFSALCPHFAKLLERSTLVQNIRDLRLDEPSNKIFELLIALCVMQFGVDVRVDDPVASSAGANPDVIALVRGEDWAFACKVAYGRNINSYRDSIMSAVGQIENSVARRGFVVVNVRNLIDHDLLWPPHPQPDGSVHYGAWPSAETAFRALELHIEKKLAGWEESFGGQVGIREVFHGKKATPIVLNYASTSVLVERGGRPTLTTLRGIFPLFLGVPVAEDDRAVLESLDRATQRPFADEL